jgi:hypothetical protein
MADSTSSGSARQRFAVCLLVARDHWRLPSSRRLSNRTLVFTPKTLVSSIRSIAAHEAHQDHKGIRRGMTRRTEPLTRRTVTVGGSGWECYSETKLPWALSVSVLGYYFCEYARVYPNKCNLATWHLGFLRFWAGNEVFGVAPAGIQLGTLACWHPCVTWQRPFRPSYQSEEFQWQDAAAT